MFQIRPAARVISASGKEQGQSRGIRFALRSAVLLLICLCLAGGAAAETVTFRGVTVDRETKEVDLGKMDIRDWEGFYAFLGQLPNLKKVNMYGSVPSLQVFRNLNMMFPNVEFGSQLRLGERRFRTDSTAFSTLYYGGARIATYQDMEMLSWCRNLYALDIGHNPVKKLDFLYKLPELRVLIVAICSLTDITPIASLKHLEYLEIFHNEITDISCLSELNYLMDLNLVKNRITDLTPLYSLKNLQRLWIHLYNQNTPKAPDEATLKSLQEALPGCHIDAVSTSTAGGWRKDPHYDVIYRMFRNREYEPFSDSKPENMPEPWRSEALQGQK